ncbi:hypothetical protein BU24DRAFT_15080 [Aaosphaeria arxii CBS 175.79]|uniref:Uncharacterized protein n=1 Tax=Aaosphaeria arxii CBS 175.79 TaxID=1450172 RepID=A0A6A5Y749_9PLEO|nr:uncharacterized protein BU24DRAFT_15080 [Aaosphaeria arxii CBS 175.79]KAF2021106.1 hypothetical protein BU24DRAFT_15080 [Aaosphaeria arxii CBS 175.79]
MFLIGRCARPTREKIVRCFSLSKISPRQWVHSEPKSIHTGKKISMCDNFQETLWIHLLTDLIICRYNNLLNRHISIKWHNKPGWHNWLARETLNLKVVGVSSNQLPVSDSIISTNKVNSRVPRQASSNILFLHFFYGQFFLFLLVWCSGSRLVSAAVPWTGAGI